MRIALAQWRSVLVLCGMLFVCACASTDVKPLDSGTAVMDKDEQELWMASERLTERIESFGAVFESEDVTVYVQDISNRLFLTLDDPPAQMATVRVMSSPTTNAFMLSNGHMYLSTGLLVRLENEDQLATIIGHELVHYINRHGLKKSRQERNKRTIAGLRTALAAGIGAAVGGYETSQTLAAMAGESGRQWVAASISGYSQDMEREADDGGFRMMADAGYDYSRAPSVFQMLMDEFGEDDDSEPYFYATHPRLAERFERYEVLAESEESVKVHVASTNTPYEHYRAMILLHNAELCLEEELFDRAERQVLDFEAHQGANARSAFLLGEISRKRVPRNVFPEQALGHYEAAIQRPDPPPEAFKQYGLLLRSKDDSRANNLLREYLRLVPDAPDKPIIQRYLETGTDAT